MSSYGLLAEIRRQIVCLLVVHKDVSSWLISMQNNFSNMPVTVHRRKLGGM